MVTKRPKLAYLAGGFYSDWRKVIADADLGFRCVDPHKENDQTACYRFVRDDLEAIEKADFVIAYYPGGYASHGMAAEIGYAAALKKVVFLIDESGVPDLFLVGLCKRLFTSIPDFVAWYRNRLEQGKPIL